ncbi:peptidylprolyl isomerase [Prochlorococcus marinus]|uniref:peptidylprolyl isomerase n=1 Tax=Prochlorococcus marinus TaxID=1219 RepID=UPI0039B08A26
MNTIKCINKEVYELLSRNQLLNSLIKSELINSILDEREVTEEMKINIKQNIFKNQNLQDDDQFNEWLKSKNSTEEELIHLITKNQRLETYCLEKYSHMAEARFLKRKDGLDQVTYSLIRIKESFLAQEIFFRIEENPSAFGDLANQYSIGSENSSRGIVGPVSLNQGHPQLVSLLKNSTPGEVNQPIRIEDFWVITRLENLKKGSLNDETIKIMSQEIFNDWLDDKVKEIANKLHNSFKFNTKK